MSRHTQNGNGLLVSPANGRRTKAKRGKVSVEDFPTLSVDELKMEANGAHEEFVGSMRSAIVEYARRAGAALVQLKAKLEHGSWSAWLKQNFIGSKENARLYMRVAKHWSLIVEQGLDREGMTLTDLRWILSESPGPRPGTEKSEPKAKAEGQQKPDLTLAVEGDEAEGQTTPPGPHIKTFHLFLHQDDLEDFKEMVRDLQAVFHTDNETDTVWAAVRYAHQEHPHG